MRERVAIRVDPNRGHAAEAAPAQAFVEQEPSCCIRRRADLWRDHIDLSPTPPKRLRERPCADITPTAFTDVPRNSGYEVQKLHSAQGGARTSIGQRKLAPRPLREVSGELVEIP